MTYTQYISWLILFGEMKGSHCNMESSHVLEQQECGESNMAVQGDESCLSIKPVPRYSQSIGSLIRFDCEARSNTMSEAKFGYCPVQVCQSNGTWSTASLSCAKNECIETGKHYNGRRVCTKSGIPCQSWTSQMPHAHGFVNGNVFPDKTIEHAGRTCRDPGFLRGSPWCYTQDNNVEWDFCDIPKCQDVPVNEIPCSEGQIEQTDCWLPDFQIRADNECVSLAPLDTFETTEGSALIYKCAKLQKGVMSFNNYCPVEVCQANGTWSPAYVSCAENECYVDGKSREYKGKRICTSNGLHCKPWNELKDKTFNLHSFHDENINSAGAYCRDPDGEKGSPWCYTDTVLWDYCNVPKCSEILTEEFICRETEATTVMVPSKSLDTTVIYAHRLEIEKSQSVDQKVTTYIVDVNKVTRPDSLKQSRFIYTTVSPTTDAKDMYSANMFETDKIQTNDDLLLPHQLQTAGTTKVIESSKTGWNVQIGEKYQTEESMEVSKQLTTFGLKDGTEHFQISSALNSGQFYTATATSQMTEKTAGAQLQTNGIKDETKPVQISETMGVSKDDTGTSTSQITSLEQLKTTKINEASQKSRGNEITKDLMTFQSTTVDKLLTIQSTIYSQDHDLTALDDDIATVKIKGGKTENPTFLISQSIDGSPTTIAVERTHKYLSIGTEQTEPNIRMYTEEPESIHTLTDDKHISTKTTAAIDGLLKTTEMIEMVKQIKQDKTTNQGIDSDQYTFTESIINLIPVNNELTTDLHDRIASVSAMTYNKKLEGESRTDTLLITQKAGKEQHSLVHETDLGLRVTSKEARTFPLPDGNIANDTNNTNENERGSSSNERQRDNVTANGQADTIQNYFNELVDTTRNTLLSSHFGSTVDDPTTKQTETNSINHKKIEASTDNIWTRQSFDNNNNHMSSSSHKDTTPKTKYNLERPIDKEIIFNSTTNVKFKPNKSESASNNIIKCQTGSVSFTQFKKAAVQSHQIQRLSSQRNILDCARICRGNSDCVLFKYLADECTIFGSDYMGDETIDCSSGQSCYRRIN